MTLIHSSCSTVNGASTPQERPEERDRQGADVDRQLELDEALDVLIERSAPLHRLDDGGERIVEKDDLACLLRHLGAGNAHCQTDVGLLQRRRIVGAIAGHRHHLVQLLQQLDDAVLVQRPGTGKDGHIRQADFQFVVGQLAELVAGHDGRVGRVDGGVSAIYQADVKGDGAGRLDVVSGIILTWMPADRHFATASLTSTRSGSRMATKPANTRSASSLSPSSARASSLSGVPSGSSA